MKKNLSPAKARALSLRRHTIQTLDPIELSRVPGGTRNGSQPSEAQCRVWTWTVNNNA